MLPSYVKLGSPEVEDMPPRSRRHARDQLGGRALSEPLAAQCRRLALLALTAVEVAIIVAGTAITASSKDGHWHPVRTVVLVLGVALVAERLGSQRHGLFVAPPIGSVLALVVLGAGPALAIAAVTVTASALLAGARGEALDRLAAVAAPVGLATVLGPSVVSGTRLGSNQSPSGQLAFVALIFCACVASYALTALLAYTRCTLRRRAPVLTAPLRDLATIARAVLVSSVLVAGIGLAYTAHNRTIALLTALVFGAGLCQTLVSEIVRARREAADLDSERVRHLSYLTTVRRLVSARCAQALEEDVIGELSRLRARLDDALKAGDTPMLGHALHDGVEILGTEVEGLRELIHELRPAVLDRHGLAAALEGLAQRASRREGIRVTLSFEPRASTQQLSASEELAVYRLVEESVRNALEHSTATRIAVVVRTHDHATTISVIDDGRRSDPSATAAGAGLTSMHERAQLIDASVAVRSGSDGGTDVEITLPLRATQRRTVRARWLERRALQRRRRAELPARGDRGAQWLLIATAAVVSIVTSSDRAWEPVALFEVLALAAVLGACWEMRFERCRFTPVAIPVALAAILLGPAPGFACAFAAAINDAAQRRISRTLAIARLASRSLTTLVASAASAVLLADGLRSIASAWEVMTAVGIFLATMALTVRVAMLYHRLSTRRVGNPAPIAQAAAPLTPVVVAESLIVGAALTDWLVHASGFVIVLGLALAAWQRMIDASAAALAAATARSAARRERLLRGVAEQEAECARWARELHDDTIQGLAIVRSQLARDNPTMEASQLHADATLMLVEVDAALSGLAHLVDEMRPTLPAAAGLLASLSVLAKRVASRDRLTVDVDAPSNCDSGFEPDQVLSIYRIAQEALTNAARHGKASHARVTIRDTGEELCVTVYDDGHGFDPATTAHGFGVAGMRQRAELLGGTLVVFSRIGTGTTVSARLPRSAARGDTSAGAGAFALRPTLGAMLTTPSNAHGT